MALVNAGATTHFVVKYDDAIGANAGSRPSAAGEPASKTSLRLVSTSPMPRAEAETRT